MEEFDLVVIGAGPGGYTGAIRAAQLGMKVACIEKSKTLGGTCLNVGCIPSKSLLNFSEKYEEAQTHFADIGIDATIKLNLKAMLDKKNQVISDLCKGIASLFVKNKIVRVEGAATIASPNLVEITHNSQKTQIKAKNILIATGSKPATIPGVEIDEKIILSSTGALALNKVPKKMIVIGGGYIGLEIGSVWRRLGSEVTIVEFADRIVPAMDHQIGKAFHQILQKQGMKFLLNTKITKAQKKGNLAHVVLENNQDNKSSEMSCDALLVCVGRKTNVENLNLETLGIKVNKTGQIQVNDHFQTDVANIYAIGDVIAGPMLAHKSEEEAVAAVEIMNGQAGHVDYDLIPSVVFTSPEVASVGATEEALKEQKIEYKVGKFPFLANSRARSVAATEGMVKLLACAKTDKILGAHIIGCDAGSLIGEVVAYMEFSGSAEDIARTCHAHPTFNEAIKEAALAIHKRTINM